MGLDRKVKGKKGTKNAKVDCKEGLNMGKRKWQRKRRVSKELKIPSEMEVAPRYNC